jgi:hypothetical protein
MKMADDTTSSTPPTVFRPQADSSADVTNLAPPPGSSRRRVEKKQRTGPFVQYVGPSTHRIIRPHQWKTLDVPLKDEKATHTWSIKNDKLIETSEFSDEQLDYLLCDDMQRNNNAHSFLEVDYNADGNLVQVVQ